MNSTWTSTALGDAGTWISGGTPATSNASYWGGTIPWMSSKSLVDFRVRDSERRLTRLGLENGSRMVPKGSILMVVRGMSLKTEFRMGITQREVAFSQDLKALTPRSGIDPVFLAYALKSRSDEVLGMVDEAGHGTGRLQTDRLLSLELPLPPFTEQRAIASTLGALDDKIESNQRLINIIPQVIRSFVDSAVVESSESIPVAGLARFINGGAYTKGATGTGRMVVRIAELNSGPGGSTVYNEIEVPEDKTARAGDLLMSWSGSLGIYRWFRDEAIINQHIFKVVPKGYPKWLVFDRLEAVMSVFQGIAADKATTMGHIKRSHLDDTRVDIPTSANISSLDGRLALLWHRLLLAERENLRLQKLRDTLIPELLSGRIRTSVKES